MDIILIFGILIYWLIRVLMEKLEPPQPPIEDITEHTLKMFQMNSPEERRKYLRDRARGKVK